MVHTSFDPSPDLLLPPLSPRQELAILARALHREGYEEHIAGHLSYKQSDGTLLVNPYHLRWDELQAKAVRWARKVLWPIGATLVGISLATPVVSPTVFDKWFVLPQLFALLPIPLASAAAFFGAWHVLSRPRLLQAGHAIAAGPVR